MLGQDTSENVRFTGRRMEGTEAKDEDENASMEGPPPRNVNMSSDVVVHAQSAVVPMGYAPRSFVHTSGIVPKIQNVVATVNLGIKLDLRKIVQSAKNAEYNPKRFSAVIMRLRYPRSTGLIFSSGKIVCIGTRSEEDARLASRKFARIIQKVGFPEVRFQSFKIQNIVGTCGVKFPIRLEGLACDHEDYSCYEPEMFPGLIYRMVQPKVVLIIFVSGKVVLTGAKTRVEIYEAFENIFPVLNEFKKSVEPGDDVGNDDDDDENDGLDELLEEGGF